MADDSDLVDDWTVASDELELVDGKWGHTRFGYLLMLKFFAREGRFPVDQSEFSDGVIGFVAGQVGVSVELVDRYSWSGRTNVYHRAEIRAHLGVSEFSNADVGGLQEWLITGVAAVERSHDRLRSALVQRCRELRIELPSVSRMDRIVRSVLVQSEGRLMSQVADLLSGDSCAQLEALVERDGPEGQDGSILELIKASPGNISLDSMLVEIDKLRSVRRVGIDVKVFDGIGPKVLAGWSARAAVESPSHLRRHRREVRLTLLAALLHVRASEIVDTLVDLLISTVHRINARADRRVTSELVKAFKKVSGKENILFSMAEAALRFPDGSVRDTIFPAVSGGENTLQDLVHEYKTKGPAYRRTVQTTLKASYSNHYRRGLIELLDVLEFRSNNRVHRPVLEALDLVRRFRSSRIRYLPTDVDVAVHRGVTGHWESMVFEGPDRRVVRSSYEVCTFQALREQLRCKEIWVVGADRWRNPDADLPSDFEARRVDHYASLAQPMDPTDFIDALRSEMDSELSLLDNSIDSLEWVEIADRGKRGPIRLTGLSAVAEPQNLRALKNEVRSTWGTVPLIDILKETVLRTGCLEKVTSVANRDMLDAETLAERLLLLVYAYGTNTGIRTVASGSHGHSEEDLRYVRRRYLTAEVANLLAIEIANAAFAARKSELWGKGSSAVASDSTHFRAFDQNIFTEWHARYGGRGVLIYWHVERKSMAIHSQLISCSASEVAAMIEGAIRHGTDMEVEGNYVDSHGQSEIGFGITRLLGFELLPRIKRINTVKLYRPSKGQPDQYQNLTAALTRPIRWDLIGEQYDQMIKYATAIRTGTATTEAILRRFTKANSIHPTYQAMIEVGRAQKTVFVARYLRDRELQREINDGLNVVESWNRGNSVLFYGKGGDLASNRREEQELSVLCLRILQSALVYINTLMIQEIAASDEWADRLTDADRRGLTPLFWSHVTPYGEVRLDMKQRLNL